MSKKAIVLYAGSLGLGFIAGIISYLDYRSGTRTVEAPVAGTNAILLHLCLAIALVIGSSLITRRLLRARAAGQMHGLIAGDGGFWKAPFTARGWSRLVFALLGLPLGLAEFLCALFGAQKTATKLERWRLKRYLGITLGATTLAKKLLGRPSDWTVASTGRLLGHFYGLARRLAGGWCI